MTSQPRLKQRQMNDEKQQRAQSDPQNASSHFINLKGSIRSIRGFSIAIEEKRRAGYDPLQPNAGKPHRIGWVALRKRRERLRTYPKTDGF